MPSLQHAQKNEQPKHIGFRLGVVAITILSIIGWGFWGYGFTVDYVVEFNDALRIHQGAVPYRDFVPTYGILYSGLASFVFLLKQFTVPALFLISVLCALVQLRYLLRTNVIKTYLGKVAFVLLYVGMAVFSLTDSNFFAGFSQSAFLGAVLFSVVLFYIQKSFSLRNAALCGFLLGLQCFTKLDFTFPAIAMLIFLTIVIPDSGAKVSLILSFAGTWCAVILLLLLSSARWDILYDSGIELILAASSLAPDTVLKNRMLAVSGGVFVIFFVLATAKSKVLNRHLKIAWWICFFIVAAIDLIRGEIDPRKELVGIKWFLFSTTAWFCLHLAWNWIKSRKRLGFAYRLRVPFCIAILCFLSFSRIFASGWYSLGYIMPFLLLIWVASSNRLYKTSSMKWVVIFGWILIGLIFTVRAGIKFSSMETADFESPYGPLKVTKNFHQEYSKLVGVAQSSGGATTMFSSYPLISVILGTKSVNYHSVLFRLQWARDQQKQEAQVLHLLSDGKPELILLDNTTSQLKPRFGSDYGQAIMKHISSNYHPIAGYGIGFNSESREAGGTLYRKN
jgi:hypothetical protein